MLYFQLKSDKIFLLVYFKKQSILLGCRNYKSKEACFKNVLKLIQCDNKIYFKDKIFYKNDYKILKLNNFYNNFNFLKYYCCA